MPPDVQLRDPAAIVAEAREAGVELWVEGSRLRFRARPGALSDSLKTLLRECRDVLVPYLRSLAATQLRREPLAENQRGLWFIHQLAPASAAYNIAFCARVHGALDLAALDETLQILADRHEVLRTTYPMVEGGPERHVAGFREIRIARCDAGGWSADELRDRVQAAYAEPFDLDRGPLFRAQVFHEAADRHVLLLSAHHMVLDGTALRVVVEELIALYTALVEGDPMPAPAEGGTFSEFVAWQQAAVAAADEARAYWADVLEPFPPALDLPTDRPRPALSAMRGGSVWHTRSAERTAAFRARARNAGVTEYQLLLAAWFAFVHRLTGQADITVGAPVHGRPSARFARTVGELINMLPLRVRDVGAGRFEDLVQQVRKVVLDGLVHQDFPLPRMVESHRGRRAEQPFQTLFALHDPGRLGSLDNLETASSHEPRTFGALSFSPYPIRQQEGQLALSLDAAPRGDELVCIWRYDADLFDRATIQGWAEAFDSFLAAIAEERWFTAPVGRIPLLAPPQRAALVEEARAARRDYPETTTVELFRRQAARRADALAVGRGADRLTYGELDRRSDALARRLTTAGVARDTLVGLCLERGPELVTAVLAVWKAGGAYVPLDPDFPPERLAYMLEDSGARVLVTRAALADRLFAGAPVHRVLLDAAAGVADAAADAAPAPPSSAAPDAPAPPAGPGDLAYVIYTSGSTGRPKGVEIEHRALVNFLWSMLHEPGLGEDDVFFAVTTLSFDIAGLELYLPLIAGARVEIGTRAEAMDGAALARRIADSSATVMQATPATWNLLLESGWTGDRRLRVLCGGEALPPELAQRLLPMCAELWNLYGPTETTIWSSAARITSAEDITIGRPIANTGIYVLDAHGEPVPRGVVGELWIGGDGVARGYLGRPELTVERFLPDPFLGGRMYRTGDSARQLADGRFVCLGRMDDQVKIRGYRIELGEIESVLHEHPQVAHAAVAVREVAGDRRLIAYVVGGAERQALIEHLRRRLPDYMVPSLFVPMEALPLSPNGKIDRNALPDPREADGARDARTSSAAAPRTAMQRTIAALWEELLGTGGIGPADNFFDLGGHSLLAATFVGRFEMATGIRINPGQVIVQTLGQLAAACEAGGESAAAAVVIDGPGADAFFFGPEDAPLFGHLHLPADGAARPGVVLAYPVGQEYMRTHRAFALLGKQLAAAGLPALRFDYFGTGDSAGDPGEARLARWLANTRAAMAELPGRGLPAPTALVGLRLGATLATLASHGARGAGGGVEGLVLWNPVVDGGAHRHELDALHRRMLRFSYVWSDADDGARPGIVELMGFPVAAALLEDLEDVDLLALDAPPAERVLLVDSAGDPALETLRDHLHGLGCDVRLERFAGPMLWLEEPFREVVPAEIWRRIVGWLARTSDVEAAS